MKYRGVNLEFKHKSNGKSLEVMASIDIDWENETLNIMGIEYKFDELLFPLYDLSGNTDYELTSDTFKRFMEDRGQ